MILHAVCERGFSYLTHIKNPWRSRLDTDILDALMRIALSKSYSTGDPVDVLLDAYARWRLKKDRNGVKKLLNDEEIKRVMEYLKEKLCVEDK